MIMKFSGDSIRARWDQLSAIDNWYTRWRVIVSSYCLPFIAYQRMLQFNPPLVFCLQICICMAQIIKVVSLHICVHIRPYVYFSDTFKLEVIEAWVAKRCRCNVRVNCAELRTPKSRNSDVSSYLRLCLEDLGRRYATFRNENSKGNYVMDVGEVILLLFFSAFCIVDVVFYESAQKWVLNDRGTFMNRKLIIVLEFFSLKNTWKIFGFDAHLLQDVWRQTAVSPIVTMKGTFKSSK